jgi:uncharacterized protein with beta-barrel porin domain
LLGSTALAGCLALTISAEPASAQVVGINQQYNNQYGLALIGAGTAYTAGFTGAGVVVAVGDSGFATTQAPFSATGKIDPRSMNYLLPQAGAAYVTTQIGPLSNTDDHGSHVSGIVAAANDQAATTGTHGVAFDSTLVLMRMVPANDNNVAPASVNLNVDPLNYLATLTDVRIFNASYGPSPRPTDPPMTVWPTRFTDPAEAAAAQTALAAGKIIVTATGNERDGHPVAGRNPSGLALYPFMQPANANSAVYADGGNNFDFSALLNQPGLIIGVMATDANKAAASFSNLCGVTASWCVAAPGVNILSVVPTTVNASGFGTQSGTSQATPHVSGALAVLSQAYPTYSSRDLARVLFATTEDLGAAGVDSTFGYGLIRLDRAIAGPTGAVGNNIAAGANVDVAAFQATYWSRPFTTDGAFSKTGAGNLIIAGVVTAAGNVGISAGAVAVDGTFSVGTNTLTVQQGALLAGFGQINGAVSIAGTLSPGQLPHVQDQVANNGLAANTAIAGTSPGTLTFNGNVAMTAAAVTSINVDGNLQTPGGPGTFSKIVVTGANNTFTAGGTLTPVLRAIPGGNNNYVADIGTKFQFLTATNGARTTGNFTTITQPTVGLAANARFDAIYAPQSVTLSVTPISIGAITPNNRPLNVVQQEVASALDRVRGARTSAANDTDPLFAGLFALDSDEAYGHALYQMSGPGTAATPAAVMQGFGAFGSVMGMRQTALVSGGAVAQTAALPSSITAFARGTDVQLSPAMMAFTQAMPGVRSGSGHNWSVWGQAFASSSRVGETTDAPGSKSSSSGFVLGADRYLTTDFLAGWAFGFARARTNSELTTANSDNYFGGVYSTWTPGSFVVDVRVSAASAKMATSRTVDFMPGEITGNARGIGAQIGGEIGYRIKISHAEFKPFVGLDVMKFYRAGYTETQETGLTYPSQTFTKVMSKLGFALSMPVEAHGVTYLPGVRAAWGRDLYDTTLVTQAALFDAAFETPAANPGRDAALIDLSITAWRTEKLRLFASLGTEIRQNALSQQIAGGFRYSW